MQNKQVIGFCLTFITSSVLVGEAAFSFPKADHSLDTEQTIHIAQGCNEEMSADQVLERDESIETCNGYRLILQRDGNLVIYLDVMRRPPLYRQVNGG